MKSFFLRNKFILIFVLILLLSIPLLLSLSSKKRTLNPPSIPIPTEVLVPSLTPSPSKAALVFPAQKTIIGKTTDEEVQKKPDLIKKESLPDEKTRYAFKSELLIAPNEVITKNGVVIFEKIVVPSDGSLKTADITSKLGQPEEIVQGSRSWGYFYKTYIYANRGVSFLFNTNTNEVFEVDLFTPTTVEDYKLNYGQDLNPNASPPVN